MRLGGIGAGTSSFKLIAIEEGSREWSRRRGDGGGWVGGGLLGGVVTLLAKEEWLKRKERVGAVAESGRAAELVVGRVPLEAGAAGEVEAEGGKGYSYGLNRSKRYGVPTKFASSSLPELEASFEGIEIGMGTGFDRDVVLVITTYRECIF